MNHLKALFLVGMASFFLSACDGFGGYPSAEFPLSSGQTLQWQEMEGEWVLVNYWAEWCKPCFEEIPELNALNELEGIRVLGVNFDNEQGEALRALVERMGIEFEVLAEDPGPRFEWQRPLALPATMVVNPEGALTEARFGKQTKEELQSLMVQ